MKKLLSIILTILMVVTTVPMAFAAECEHPEVDARKICKSCGEFTGPVAVLGEGVNTSVTTNDTYIKFVAPETAKYLLRSSDKTRYAFSVYDENFNRLYGTNSVGIAYTREYEKGKTYYIAIMVYPSTNYIESTFTMYPECINHVGTEQTCIGYICDFCNKYYGETNDVHYDRGDGICRRCNGFVGPEIKAGETYKADSGLTKYVKFVPVVDGTYIISADVPAYSYIELYKEVDGKRQGVAYESWGDGYGELSLSYNFTAGETYYFICGNFEGWLIEYVTLRCETHKGTEQTCYGYICDACGEYFGEALGHDIVTDEAVAPTCTEAGLTAGQHCSRCDDMTVAQQEIPALGHADEDGDTMCDNCGEQLTCEDCLRPVHGDSFAEKLICLIVMFINLVKSMFA
ncbi:MAG: hypothetical protein IJM97_06705 [Clostridia bacterium]|nr:hypothetical protein [Clostridia bacterium]